MADIAETTQNIIVGLKEQEKILKDIIQNGGEVPDDIKELIVTAENMIDLANKLKQSTKDEETVIALCLKCKDTNVNKFLILCTDV